MADVQEVVLPSGEVVWVRVTPEQGPGDVAGRGRSGQARVVEGFSELVRGIAGSLNNALQHVAPVTITAEFGIEFAVKTGKVIGVLTEAGATTSVTVTLTWSRASPDESSGQSRSAAIPVAPGPGADSGGGQPGPAADS